MQVGSTGPDTLTARPRIFHAASPALFFLLAFAPAAFAQPTLSKVFTPSTIGPGSVSTATFTITNGSGSPVTGLAFTDVLPAAVTIADPAVASTDCDLSDGGILSAPDGGSTITLSNAGVGGSQSCTVTVDVTASTPGMHTNPAVTLNSDAGSSMSAAIDLTVNANRPGFSKSFAPSSVVPGDRSTLTFTIDNTANTGRVGNLDFIDNLPAGVVVADPANAATDCVSPNLQDTTVYAVPGSSVIVLDANGSNIAAGFETVDAGATCTVSVDVVAVGVGTLDNVTNNLLADFTAAGKASDTLAVTFTPLVVTKTFTDDPVPPGGDVTLEFTIANFDRSFSATDVAFTDDLTTLSPALPGLTVASLLSNDCGGSVTGVGGTFVDLSGGVIAPEASCTLRVRLSVPGAATPGAYVNTTSTVTAMVDGSPVVGNLSTETLFVEPVPVLTFEILESGTLLPDPVINAGDSVVFRYTITNSSTTSMATDITFIDELTDGGPGTGFLPFPPSFVLPPSPDPPCGAGSSVSMIFPDTGRESLELTGGSLAAAPGAGATCSFDVTVTVPSDIGPGLYTNTTEEITATVDGATRLGDPASDSLTVIAAPKLLKEFLDPVPPGGTVTLEFTLSYPAEATGNATDIAFTDDLASVLTGLTANLPPSPDPPCGPGSTLTGSAGDTLLTFMGGSLTPGQSCTFSVDLTVPSASSGNHANTTSQVSATVQGLPATSAAASDTLNVSGLTFSKEFLGDPAFPGQFVTLRFTIENIHPTDDATAIAFSDNLAAVLPGTPDLVASLPPATDTCGGTMSGPTSLSYSGGSVTAGTTCTIELDVLVPLGTADGQYGNVTSSLSATQSGGGVVVDPASDVLTVDSNRLVLVKEFTDDPVAPGDSVTLEFTLSNTDTSLMASSVAFTDDLGAALTGLIFDSVLLDTCGGTVLGETTTQISVSDVSLPADTSCTLRLSLVVPGGATAGSYVNTTSDVTGTMSGYAATGSPAEDTLTVFQRLDFTKSFDGPTVEGGTAVLTFTLTNPGTETASHLSFSDNLNAVIPGLVATSLPAVPCGAGSTLSGVSFLTFTGGELAPMGMCTFDVEVLLPAPADPGTFPNVTSVLVQNGLVVSEPATADLVVEPPPDFAKTFVPDVVGQGLVSTLVFDIDNTASSLAASDLDFTDNLPSGLLIAMPPNASTTCTGGTLTADAGTAMIHYTGGSVGAGASCMVQVDVVNSTTGFFYNTTGKLTSSSGDSGTASDTLAVDPPPGFSKSFSPHKIAIGGVSTLTFTINNTLATIDATGLDFADNLPPEVLIATPGNASTTCTGGTLTAADGTGVITYTGGSVGAGMSCTVQVDVTSSTVGTHENVSGPLTSVLGSSGKASANLRVNPPPQFSKAFAPDPTIIGGVVTLTFTIDNTESTASADALDFTDMLPAALLVADPANVMNTGCGGMVTAVAGTATIHLTGGSVASSSICTLSVDVVTSAAGDIVNTTGELTSSLGSSGTAEATLRVNPPPVFSKAFVPSEIQVGDTGTLVFSINNTASTADATDLDFSDTMPAEVTIADPPNATTDCGGGIVTAVAGTGIVAYTGGIVTAAVNCTLSVDITSGTLGMHVNTSGELTSSLGASGTAEATLTVVDLEPPVVSSVTTSAGVLSECDTVRSLISTMDVTITDGRTPIVGADSTAAYLLVEAGADGDFTTADCTGAAGDDVAVAVLSVTVDDTDPLSVVAGVEVAGSTGLAAGAYRFFVCDTITDTAGNALDGDGDLTAGGDFEVPFFRADPGNRLVNGNFDDCPATLDPWTPVAVPPNAIQLGVPGTDDNLGSPLSASAWMMQSVADATSFGQCVGVESDVLYDFESWLRYAAPTEAVALFVQTCEYYDAAGCTGTILGESSVAAVLEDSGGTWTFSETIVRTATGAASALCTFETGPLGGNSLFDLYLDGLFFGAGDLGPIFSDGFESGDTSAWSSAVP